MATEGGAKALGLNAGRIEPGRLADIILVDIAAPSMSPIHDPISTLVYCGRAADVSSVIINGKVIMEQHKILTIDAPAKVQEAVAQGAAHFAEIETGPLHSEF